MTSATKKTQLRLAALLASSVLLAGGADVAASAHWSKAEPGVSPISDAGLTWLWFEPQPSLKIIHVQIENQAFEALKDGTLRTLVQEFIAVYNDLAGRVIAGSSATPTLGLGRSETPSMFEARDQLLRAGLRLIYAMKSIPPGQEHIFVDNPPAILIDSRNVDNVYTTDYAILIDAGGNDVYLNNAGGNNLDKGACGGESLRAAAVLLDGAGDDSYNSTRSCGANGGAVLGFGMLVDLEGNDSYIATRGGVNGGAGVGGAGFLLDMSGNDLYSARNGGVNGGGALGGIGSLLDFGGNDTYVATSHGTNGGGWFAGAGELLDLAGSDVYTATDEGTNGGGSVLAVGRLIDLSGDDRYTAGSLGVNGGGLQGSGLLLDLGGLDSYRDYVTNCEDCVQVPKEEWGVQLDLWEPLDRMAGEHLPLELCLRVRGACPEPLLQAH